MGPPGRRRRSGGRCLPLKPPGSGQGGAQGALDPLRPAAAGSTTPRPAVPPPGPPPAPWTARRQSFSSSAADRPAHDALSAYVAGVGARRALPVAGTGSAASDRGPAPDRRLRQLGRRHRGAQLDRLRSTATAALSSGARMPWAPLVGSNAVGSHAWPPRQARGPRLAGREAESPVEDSAPVKMMATLMSTHPSRA
eukprot:COSAG04_NODE_296_length_17642_cov_88.702388_7_plen_196_part_00